MKVEVMIPILTMLPTENMCELVYHDTRRIAYYDKGEENILQSICYLQEFISLSISL